MPMSPNQTSVSRRTTLAAFASSGVGLALAAARPAMAQDAARKDFSDHPMVGIWLAVTPDGPGPSIFLADGSFISGSSPVATGPDGSLTFMSPQIGVWEPDPDNERGIHFTTVQNVHDASGAFTGTGTVDGYPVASEDGQSFYDDGKRVRVTFRDAANTVTMVLGEDGSLPPIFGNRMVPGNPAYQEGTPEASPEG